MITSNQIKKTEHYKSLDNIQKSLIIKKTQSEKIDLGVNMSQLKSYDFWVEKTSPRHHVKSIVKELISI